MKSVGICVLSVILGILFFQDFASAQNVINTQGFTRFENNGGKYSFVCPQQCIVILDTLRSQADFVRIKGSAKGQGTLGYGFLAGQQVIPAEGAQITGPQQFLNKTFFFTNFSAINQIPAGSPLALVMQGNLEFTDFQLTTAHSNLFQSLGLVWSQIWKVEPLTPYSINLRYGTQIGGWNIVVWGYLFFVFILVVLLFKRKYSFHLRIFFSTIIFLAIGFKNTFDYAYTFSTHISVFSQNSSFPGYDDYYSFVSQARKGMGIDDFSSKKCSVYMQCGQDWPFCPHMQLLFLKPCDRVLTGDMADFFVFYKTPVPSQFSHLTSLLESRGSSLLIRK